MHRARPIVAAAALALGLLSTACSSLVPFTQEIRTEHNLAADDLKNLQFYTSQKIVLRHELESGGRQITGSHKLVVVSGKTIEEVVVEARTPGVVTAISEGSLAVSFEPGSSMLFAAAAEPGTPPSPDQVFAQPPPSVDPFPGNHGTPEPFPLHATSNFGGSYWIATGPTSNIIYQGTSFTPIDDTLHAHLMIDSESLQQVVKSRKVLPGMRLPSR